MDYAIDIEREETKENTTTNTAHSAAMAGSFGIGVVPAHAGKDY